MASFFYLAKLWRCHFKGISTHSSIHLFSFFWKRKCTENKNKVYSLASINSSSNRLLLCSESSFCKASELTLVDESPWYLLVVWALSGLSLAINARKSQCGDNHIRWKRIEMFRGDKLIRYHTFNEVHVKEEHIGSLLCG